MACQYQQCKNLLDCPLKDYPYQFLKFLQGLMLKL
jgi:hypothetical protein